MDNVKEMNPRRQKFVAERIKGHTATRAAQRAGYSKKTAYSSGQRLLKNVEISNAIQSGLNRVTKRAELKAADVLAEIRRVAFSDLSKAYAKNGSLLHPKEMPKDLRHALCQIESQELFDGAGGDRALIGTTKKIKLHDKVRALEMLAKYFGLLTEKIEHSGAIGAGDRLTEDEFRKIANDPRAAELALELAERIAVPPNQKNGEPDGQNQ